MGNENSLVLKLTPKGKSSPSMLFSGDFENRSPCKICGGCTDTEWKNKNFHCLNSSATYYTKNGPTELKTGLKSDALMLSHHGTCTKGNGDLWFLEQALKYDATRFFSVLSANPQGEYKLPRCETIVNLMSRYTGRGTALKNIYCRTGSVNPKVVDRGQIEYRPGTFDIFQTLTPVSFPVNWNQIPINHFIRTTMQKTGRYGTVIMEEINPNYPFAQED